MRYVLREAASGFVYDRFDSRAEAQAAKRAEERAGAPVLEIVED